MPRQSFPSLRLHRPISRLFIVLGDQLDVDHPVFRSADPDRDGVLMMEVDAEATTVASHRQRTAFFLAAMRHFALILHERDVPLHYVTLDDPDNTQSFETEVVRFARAATAEQLIVVQPGEWRVEAQLERAADELGIPLEILEDDHFLCPMEVFEAWADGRKSMLLEHFYRAERKRLNILIDADGGPTGGAWNFDRENRAPFRTAPDIRRPYRPQVDDITQEVIELVNRRFPDAPGRLDSFTWPVTREKALRAMHDFMDHRLANFGLHQDAMWTNESTLNHARLSAALNVKLLNPRELVHAAVERFERSAAPIQAVEGFIRQIVGWREFIRG
ncbi:MAG: cryptochrome/photolyase family protein, partial [Phycisphaerales bacterium]|nr:cryptochrome/photolyase family protein [Phycisphaerales bacterium]